MSHPKVTKQPGISNDLRVNTWIKYVGDEVGMTKCFCCAIAKITRSTYVCGHVISRKENGSTTIDNLRPICVPCNSSMGSKNMVDFAKENGYQDRWPEGHDVGATNTEKKVEQIPKNKPTSTTEKKIPNSERADAKTGNADKKKVDKTEKKIARPITFDDEVEGEPNLTAEIDLAAKKLEPDDVCIIQVRGNALIAYLRGVQRYKYNRETKTETVNRMVQRYNAEFISTGVYDLRTTHFGICLVPGKTGLTKVLIDGAHRNEMILQLKHPEKILAVLWIKRCRTEEQVSTEFYKMNCGTPVPLSYYNFVVNKILDEFVPGRLEQNYPNMARDGLAGNAIRPRYKISEVKDELSIQLREQFVDGHITVELLETAFERVNDAYRTEFEQLDSEQKKKAHQKAYKLSDKMIKAAVDSGFYVGLDFGKNWAKWVAQTVIEMLKEDAEEDADDKSPEETSE